MKWCKWYNAECQGEDGCDLTPCRGSYSDDNGENYKDVDKEINYDSSNYTKENY